MVSLQESYEGYSLEMPCFQIIWVQARSKAAFEEACQEVENDAEQNQWIDYQSVQWAEKP